jgi:hypothetical protein
VSIDTIAPQLPLVWPEPRVSGGSARYACELPTDGVLRAAVTLFGVVSAIDDRAVDWLEGFLADHKDTKLRLVISLHPTCRTSVSALQKLVRLMQSDEDRATFKVFPEESLRDRSSNLLCVCGADGSLTILSGPTENLGFAAATPSHANVATQVDAATFESCRKWFDYLWAVAGPLNPEIAASMPRLVLPEGEIEAARQWESFRKQCLDQGTAEAPTIRVEVDQESGEIVLLYALGEPVESPTEAIGAPTLDLFADGVARMFVLGSLVTIDKLSRIPPLEAPVKPEWFGVDSFRQTGMVRAQTSFKVAPFDESMLKKIDRLRRVSGELLPRYSFSLADGVRWIPKKAIPFFEAALAAANADAKELLGATIGDSVESFLVSQRDRIRADAQRMYEVYHPNGKIPESAVDSIFNELKVRLDKTKADKIIPRVAYAPIAFNPTGSSDWSSPWGQAFALLKGIAEFPREAMTDRFFWQGIKTDEDALIQAMNVADDCLVKEYGGRKAKLRAEYELDLIKRLEDATADALAKCRVLWVLITTGKAEAVVALIDATTAKPDVPE